MDAGGPHGYRHQPELDGGSVGALKLGPDATAQAVAINRKAADQMPAEAIGDPGRQQQALERVIALDIDVELDHMLEGIAP